MSSKYTRISKNRRPVIVPVGPSIAYVTLTQGQYALIDSDDATYASRFDWHADAQNAGFYAKRRRKASAGTGQICLQADLMLPLEGMMVDHKNGNTLDNRRCNLRHATHQQNMRNRKMQSNNVSGYRGVAWNKRAKVWVASIKVNGVQTHLGSFASVEDAYAAYCVASATHHGEFARVA